MNEVPKYYSLTSSIVIITMDRPTETVRCLRSIILQTRLPEEIIVVDASKQTRNLKEQIAKVLKNLPIKFYYLHTAPSTSAQRNIGAQMAHTDVIFFIDDDVVLDPHHNDAIMKVYETNPKGTIGGVRGNNISLRPKEPFWRRLMRRIFLLEEYRPWKPARMKLSGFASTSDRIRIFSKIEIAPSTCISYWRKIFLKYLFDTTFDGYILGEDQDLSWRISRKYPIYHTPTAVFSHLPSPRRLKDSFQMTKRWFYMHRYFFKKNFGKSVIHRLARTWAIIGYILFFTIDGLRRKNFERLKGLLSALREPLPDSEI